MTRLRVGQGGVDHQLATLGACLFAQEVHQAAEADQVPVCLGDEVLVAVHGQAVQGPIEQGEIDMHQARKAAHPLICRGVELHTSKRFKEQSICTDVDIECVVGSIPPGEFTANAGDPQVQLILFLRISCRAR